MPRLATAALAVLTSILLASGVGGISRHAQSVVCQERQGPLGFDACATVHVRLLGGRPHDASDTYVHVKPVLSPNRPIFVEGLRHVGGALDSIQVPIHRVRSLPDSSLPADTVTALVFAVQLLNKNIAGRPPVPNRVITWLQSDTARVVLRLLPQGDIPVAVPVSLSFKHEVRWQRKTSPPAS